MNFLPLKLHRMYPCCDEMYPCCRKVYPFYDKRYPCCDGMYLSYDKMYPFGREMYPSHDKMYPSSGRMYLSSSQMDRYLQLNHPHNVCKDATCRNICTRTCSFYDHWLLRITLCVEQHQVVFSV